MESELQRIMAHLSSKKETVSNNQKLQQEIQAVSAVLDQKGTRHARLKADVEQLKHYIQSIHSGPQNLSDLQQQVSTVLGDLQTALAAETASFVGFAEADLLQKQLKKAEEDLVTRSTELLQLRQQVTMGTSQGGDESMELARLRDAVKEGNTQKEQLRKALLYTQTLYEQMQKDKDSHSEMLETQLRQVENLLQESRTERDSERQLLTKRFELESKKLQTEKQQLQDELNLLKGKSNQTQNSFSGHSEAAMPRLPNGVPS
uniref:Uncharacterized protein n=1 Tax=Eutreptiella gymnastica TaxID=73025 RepID=A0A7S4CKH4_9EUGL